MTSDGSVPKTRRSNFWFVLVGIAVLVMGAVFVVWWRYVEPFQRQAALIRHLQQNCALHCDYSPPVCPEWFPDSQKDFFRKCTSLYVNIDWNDSGPLKFKGEDFRLLGELPYVENVEIRNQVVSVKSLSRLMAMPTVKHLEFFNTKFEGEGFETLPEMPQLEMLGLEGRHDQMPPGRMIAPVALAEVLKRTPNLKELRLINQPMPPRSDELLKAIGGLDHLEKLVLHNFYLEDRHLRVLAEAANPAMRHSLRNLQLSCSRSHLQFWYRDSYLKIRPEGWRHPGTPPPLPYPHPKDPSAKGMNYLTVFKEMETLGIYGYETFVDEDPTGFFDAFPKLAEVNTFKVRKYWQKLRDYKRKRPGLRFY